MIAKFKKKSKCVEVIKKFKSFFRVVVSRLKSDCP